MFPCCCDIRYHLANLKQLKILKEKYNIPFYLHKNESFILETYEASCKLFGLEPNPKPQVDIWFDSECELNINKFKFNSRKASKDFTKNNTNILFTLFFMLLKS